MWGQMEGGRVWKRFDRVLKDGAVKKFKIQQITKDMYEGVADFMEEHFLPEEPFTLATGILESPREIKVLRKIWTEEVLPKNISIVCLVDDDSPSPEIVGLNLLVIATKDEEELPEEPRAMMDILRYVEGNYNIFKSFGVDAYLTGFGLGVKKKYRGLGIATELLLLRSDIGLDLDIKITATIFASEGGQKAATKAGMEKHMEMEYDIIEKKFNCKFEQDCRSLCVMYKWFS